MLIKNIVLNFLLNEWLELKLIFYSFKFILMTYIRCDGTEKTTQMMLGDMITRPKLSDKLLSKPPFRFLFDIVLEVIKGMYM